MKRIVVACVVTLCVSVTAIADDPATDDIQSIAQSIEGYVKDFNEANVSGIVSRWSENGRMTDVDGNVIQGRDKLTEQLTAYFKDVQGALLSVDVQSLEWISPSVARETGVATITVADQQPERTDYVAMHIKTAEGWKLDSIVEGPFAAPAPSNYERLKDLEWMIGTWQAENDQSSITTTCRWSKNQNFIIRSFAVQNEGQDTFEGTQVIGWDPINNAIRSWTFDSDGGYAAGRWTIEDGRWLENSKSILPDGRVGSSTHIFRHSDDGSVSYQAIARQVDDELLPSVGPVTVNRSE